MRLIVLSVLFLPFAQCLWPIPRNLSTGNLPLILSNTFKIEAAFGTSTPQDLKKAVDRTLRYLQNDKLGRLVVGRDPGDVSLSNAPTLSRLVLHLNSNVTEPSPLLVNYAYQSALHIRSIAEETSRPVEERDESYTLQIPQDGLDASLTANTALGLLRGLTTFGQLWYQYEDWTYTVEAPVRISDEPYYKWRGLHLDTSRNFYPVDDLKRTLDAMSWTKLNIFHWHVVDSQSFPLALPGFEYLAENGAYSLEQYYSTDDLDDIVAYAAERGIDVMLEIDTPGHTAAIHDSHPEFVACFEATPWSKYAHEPPAGQLRLTEPAVINFTQSLFEAAIARTPGKYFSTGGDEINSNCYKEDPVVRASLARTGKSLQEALATYTKSTHAPILESGKTPVVWQEMVLDHGDLGLDPKTVVLIWVSSKDAKRVAKAGYKIIHAPSDYFYLDCGHGAWLGKPSKHTSWCDPFKTWHKAYSFNPKAGLSESEAVLVLGGQQLLWSEQSDPSNLDSTLWPRAAAAAEVFWTGPTHPNGHPLDTREALHRLHDLRYRMVQRGVKAIALQPEYCALRPHACDE